MLEVLLAEHDEGMARIGGFMAGSARARSAAEETVLRRLYHRLPWLLIGLIGAMASALLVGAFEEELDERFSSLSSCQLSSTWPMRSAGRPGWF
jgi:magnesium transporter